jgi:hypothetical protein
MFRRRSAAPRGHEYTSMTITELRRIAGSPTDKRSRTAQMWLHVATHQPDGLRMVPVDGLDKNTPMHALPHLRDQSVHGTRRHDARTRTIRRRNAHDR